MIKNELQGKKIDRSEFKNTLMYWQMFGVPLFGRDIESLLRIVLKSDNDSKLWLATVNPEFVMNALEDRAFMKLLQDRTSVNVVDGIGLVWAKLVKLRIRNEELGIKKIFTKLFWGLVIGVEILQGKHRETLITGVELMDRLCAMAEQDNKTVYFYGGWGDRSKRTAQHFLNKYPKLKVVGAQAEDYDIKTKVDFLFVARAMKKQELWIDEHFDKLDVKLVIGLGRSFDYYSGDLKRAPEWVQKMGFEWLFSLLMEPKRWKRQLALPRFIWKVLTD